MRNPITPSVARAARVRLVFYELFPVLGLLVTCLLGVGVFAMISYIPGRFIAVCVLLTGYILGLKIVVGIGKSTFHSDLKVLCEAGSVSNIILVLQTLRRRATSGGIEEESLRSLFEAIVREENLSKMSPLDRAMLADVVAHCVNAGHNVSSVGLEAVYKCESDCKPSLLMKNRIIRLGKSDQKLKALAEKSYKA